MMTQEDKINYELPKLISFFNNTAFGGTICHTGGANTGDLCNSGGSASGAGVGDCAPGDSASDDCAEGAGAGDSCGQGGGAIGADCDSQGSAVSS